MKNSLRIRVLLVLLFVFDVTSKLTFSQVQSGSFVFEGVLRDYIVFLPQIYNGVDKLPLVFNLHGNTTNAQWQMDYSLMNEVADTAGFIVVYPNGITNSWNTGSLTVTEPTVNDVGFISKLIDTLEAKYNIDLAHVYSCGFSRGGCMTNRLVSDIGYRLAAVAEVASGLRPQVKYAPVRPFPVLICHGTSDNVVPYNGSNDYLSKQEELDFWIQQNGCQSNADTVLLPDLDPNDGCSVEKISYTNCNQESSILFLKVLGGGHQWPGGARRLMQYGNLNKDINVSAEIWSFFKDYSNPLVDLAFEKSNEVLRKSLSPAVDTLRVISELYNPKAHQVNVIAKIQADNSTFQDSFQLYDDGMHNDKNFNDNCFGGMKLLSSLVEDMFKVNIYVDDLTAGVSLSNPFLSKFSTAGPIVLDSLPFGPVPVLKYGFKPYLKNSGVVKTINNVKLKISSNDPWITSITPAERYYPDIEPGSTKGESQIFGVAYDTTSFPGYFNLKFEISSDNYVYWVIDTTIVVSPTSVGDKIQEQLTFMLEQNYPNPFNPSTKISFIIPLLGGDERGGLVTLKIYDLLGNEVTTLVDEYKPAGNYRIEFDAGKLSSGVYFYQLKAGSLIETKKMVLMK